MDHAEEILSDNFLERPIRDNSLAWVVVKNSPAYRKVGMYMLVDLGISESSIKHRVVAMKRHGHRRSGEATERDDRGKESQRVDAIKGHERSHGHSPKHSHEHTTGHNHGCSGGSRSARERHDAAVRASHRASDLRNQSDDCELRLRVTRTNVLQGMFQWLVSVLEHHVALLLLQQEGVTLSDFIHVTGVLFHAYLIAMDVEGILHRLENDVIRERRNGRCVAMETKAGTAVENFRDHSLMWTMFPTGVITLDDLQFTEL